MRKFSERRYGFILAGFIVTVSLLLAGDTYTLIALGRLTTDQAHEVRARVHEADIRQGENCQLFKRFHSLSVRQLRDTRKYLAALQPGQGDQLLNSFIHASLPKLVAQTRVDVPPRYCSP